MEGRGESYFVSVAQRVSFVRNHPSQKHSGGQINQGVKPFRQKRGFTPFSEQSNHEARLIFAARSSIMGSMLQAKSRNWRHYAYYNIVYMVYFIQRAGMDLRDVLLQCKRVKVG